jgi:hypothetical protein
MGLVRSGVVMFVSSLIFLSLFVGGIFLTLDWSLEYENLRPNLISFSGNFIDGMNVSEMIDENYDLMIYYCQINGNESFNFSLMEDFEIEIPCSVIYEGSESIINYGLDNIILELYYKNYDCSFVQCISSMSEPFVLVSEKSWQFFHSKFYLIFVVFVVLFVLMFLLMKRKYSAFTLTGVLMIVVSLFLKNINWLAKLLPDGYVEDLVLIFFSQSHNVFIIMLIVGIVMLLLGVAFEFLGIGVYLAKLFGFFKDDLKKDDDAVKNKGKKGEFLLSGGEDSCETSKLKKEITKLKSEISKVKESFIHRK